MTPSHQPIHQQILARVTSPYGDSPIFKDLKHSDEADATRATNPAAQQAVLDMSSNQYKIATKNSPAPVKVKALGSTLNKKSLFDGLEEFDATVEGFNLKPNAKRLVIKPKARNVESSNPSNSIGSAPNTPQSRPKAATPGKERESFGGSIPSEPPAGNSPGTANGRESQDISRRESWLHPNNLEKVRQHNIQTGMDQGSPHNSTLNELVPRKPLETYRPSSTVRLSVSTIPENPFEDQGSTIARRETFTSEQANESVLSSRSHEADDSTANRSRLAIEAAAAEAGDYESHPTGIVLRRVGYYTIPSLDDLRSYLAEDGSCVVPNFTVGREGYGNVFFGKEMDVAGLNIDEIGKRFVYSIMFR